jgi:hypothetical protein
MLLKPDPALGWTPAAAPVDCCCWLPGNVSLAAILLPPLLLLLPLLPLSVLKRRLIPDSKLCSFLLPLAPFAAPPLLIMPATRAAGLAPAARSAATAASCCCCADRLLSSSFLQAVVKAGRKQASNQLLLATFLALEISRGQGILCWQAMLNHFACNCMHALVSDGTTHHLSLLPNSET